MKLLNLAKPIIKTLSLSSLVLSLPCLGWGVDGHRIVAAIAEGRLTEAAKAKAKAILAEDLKHPEASAEVARDTFLSRKEIADWADQVRSTKKGNPDYDKWHATRDWHYINIPIDAKSSEFKVADYCSNEDCVVERVKSLKTALSQGAKYRYGSQQQFTLTQDQILKFLVHFVGDLHQPLHCAVWDDDEGGNLRKVEFFDQKQVVFGPRREFLDLHEVWDQSILDKLMKSKQKTPLTYAALLNNQIDQENTSSWMGSVDQWAWDSNRLAKTVSYNGIRSEKMIKGESNEDVPASILREPYYDKAAPVVEKQLMRAGYRLAALLNQALAP